MFAVRNFGVSSILMRQKGVSMISCVNVIRFADLHCSVRRKDWLRF